MEALTDPSRLFKPLQWDADVFRALVDQCTTMNFYDDAVMDIILAGRRKAASRSTT